MIMQLLLEQQIVQEILLIKLYCNIDDVDNVLPSIQGPSGNSGDETSTASVEENTTSIHTFTAPNEENSVTWNISGGVDQLRFSIDEASGALSFVNPLTLNLILIVMTR